MARILISAGDPSGDHQAARLVTALRAARPDLTFYGPGGPEMAEAGVEVTDDLVSLSAIGLWDVLPSVPRALVMRARLRARARRDRPDLAILVDCGAFNLKLGRRLKAQGVPVLGYFPPGSWSRSLKRARGVAEAYSAVATVFPHALPAFAELGFPATLVGHPLVDELAPLVEARQGMSLDPPVLALLPGSRRQEIRHILAPMLEAAAVLRRRWPDLRVVVSLAPSAPRRLFDELVARAGVPVEVVSGSRDAMAMATAGIVKSGTVALEATLLGLPFVCAYRVGLLSYCVAWCYYWPRPEFWAMPNVLLSRMVVPQCAQLKVNGPTLAETVTPLLNDTPERAAMLEGLAEASASLGGGGATERTTRLVLDMLGEAAAPL
ncbi:MAG: lipid-A-disaccharide synthase [Armatimonadetes bacterium]|nr:lipid-A-disaccharide synthase [Armatimonadota bacterium]